MSPGAQNSGEEWGGEEWRVTGGGPAMEEGVSSQTGERTTEIA